MRKYLLRGALLLGTIGAVIAGAAAFSAFEAHVVNVTATIENATDISTNSLALGEIFPQEILHNPVTLSLSSSFLSGNNTNASEVDYVLKQKPTCGLPVASSSPVAYSAIEQVTENADGVFSCPDAASGYVILPLLCPYLSKTGSNPGDVSIPSFHGPTTTPAWTDQVSIANEASGKLLKGGPTSDTWDIDIHTPCFAGQCAQDWNSFVLKANPNLAGSPESYQADPALQHQVFGCDLWYEVSGISQASTTPTTGTLTIVKNVTGGNGTFDFAVSGASASTPQISTTGGTGSTTPMTVTAGTYTVTETGNGGASLLGAICNDGSSSATTTGVTGINIPAGGNVTCTFSNEFLQ